jgi:hypothetical protein
MNANALREFLVGVDDGSLRDAGRRDANRFFARRMTVE